MGAATQRRKALRCVWGGDTEEGRGKRREGKGREGRGLKQIIHFKKTHSMLSGVPVSTQGLSAMPPLSTKTKKMTHVWAHITILTLPPFVKLVICVLIQTGSQGCSLCMNRT